MSFEIPRFESFVEAEKVIVTADHTSLDPAVLFDMLTELSFREYNVATPKDQNLYLREITDEPMSRRVETELPVQEASIRVIGLLALFSVNSNHLLDVSERQLQALVDHSTRRVARHTTS